MRLKYGGEVHLPAVIHEYAPRQQHAGGLSAYAPGADEPLADGDEVIQRDVPLRQLAEGGLVSQYKAGKLVFERPYLGRIFGSRSRRLAVLHKPVVNAVPGRGRAGALDEGLGEGSRRDGGGFAALKDRLPGGFLHAVRQEHLGRVAFPDLLRVDVEHSLRLVDVDEYLGGALDARDSLMAVLAVDEREIGQRPELQDERAGHLEKIGHQLVGSPLGDQEGQVIEDIGRTGAVGFDDGVQFGGETIEAGAGIHPYNVDAVGNG